MGCGCSDSGMPCKCSKTHVKRALRANPVLPVVKPIQIAGGNLLKPQPADLIQLPPGGVNPEFVGAAPGGVVLKKAVQIGGGVQRGGGGAVGAGGFSPA